MLEQLRRVLELTAVHLAPGEREAVAQGERCVGTHATPQVFKRFGRLVVAICGDESLGRCKQIRKIVADERKRRHGRKFEK
jgi:hypothetical protein